MYGFVLWVLTVENENRKPNYRELLNIVNKLLHIFSESNPPLGRGSPGMSILPACCELWGRELSLDLLIMSTILFQTSGNMEMA